MKQLIRMLVVGLVFAALTLPAHAQKPPGFLGKRLMVGYGFYTIPSWSSPNANGNSYFYSQNFRHRLHVDWVQTSHRSVGFQFGYMRSTSPLTQYTIATNKYRDAQKDAPIKAWHMGPEWKWFGGKSSAAPLGNYWSLGFDFVFYQSVPFPGTLVYTTPQPIVGSDATSELAARTSWVRFMPTFGTGQQRVIGDAVTIDIGLQLGWLFFSRGINLGKNLSGGPFWPEYAADLTTVSAARRLFRANLLNFRLGIGLIR